MITKSIISIITDIINGAFYVFGTRLIKLKGLYSRNQLTLERTFLNIEEIGTE